MYFDQLKSYLLPKILYILVNVILVDDTVNLCLLHVVLQTKPYCINVYCHKCIIILNSGFSFILLKLPTKVQFLMLLVFYIKFIWFHPYFVTNTQICYPRLLIRLGRLNHHQCVPVNIIEKHWSLYVQPIVNYLICCPRSLIRPSKLNHHLGSSGAS